MLECHQEVKVHVWGGISWNGAITVCIFSSIMNAEVYIQIVMQCLISSIQHLYPKHHHFMQDNNPKHTSKAVQTFLKNNKFNWMQTLPDIINLIECIWHELKITFIHNLILFVGLRILEPSNQRGSWDKRVFDAA